MPFFAWSTVNSWLQFVLLILLSSCFPSSARQVGDGCVSVRSGHVLVSALVLVGTGKGWDEQCLYREREGSKHSGDPEGHRVLWTGTACAGRGIQGM